MSEVKFIMPTGSVYEFNGTKCQWYWAPIVITVSDYHCKNENKLREKARKKFAKAICSLVSTFQGKDHKCFNKIYFEAVKEIEPLPKRKYVRKHAIAEYVDLFGATKQIMNTGDERIKPTKKGS